MSSTGWRKEGHPASIISASITHHGMYFSSTPLSLPPSLLLSEKDVMGCVRMIHIQTANQVDLEESIKLAQVCTKG